MGENINLSISIPYSSVTTVESAVDCSSDLILSWLVSLQRSRLLFHWHRISITLIVFVQLVIWSKIMPPLHEPIKSPISNPRPSQANRITVQQPSLTNEIQEHEPLPQLVRYKIQPWHTTKSLILSALHNDYLWLRYKSRDTDLSAVIGLELVTWCWNWNMIGQERAGSQRHVE